MPDLNSVLQLHRGEEKFHSDAISGCSGKEIDGLESLGDPAEMHYQEIRSVTTLAPEWAISPLPYFFGLRADPQPSLILGISKKEGDTPFHYSGGE